jgi:hypothetical protein
VTGVQTCALPISLRIKNRIAQGLCDRAWQVPESLRDACREALPPDYAFDGELVGRAR